MTSKRTTCERKAPPVAFTNAELDRLDDRLRLAAIADDLRTCIDGGVETAIAWHTVGAPDKRYSVALMFEVPSKRTTDGRSFKPLRIYGRSLADALKKAAAETRRRIRAQARRGAR